MQLVKFSLHQATERHQSIKAAVGDVFSTQHAVSVLLESGISKAC